MDDKYRNRLTCDHGLVRNFFDEAFSLGLGDVEVKAGGQPEEAEEEAAEDDQTFETHINEIS